MNEFYVYKHLTADTKELFYIGKGKDRRAFDTVSGRNKLWKNIYEKHGRVIEFIKENITEDEALKLEVELIKQFKPRANFSAGGRGGATGYKHTAESLKRRSETQSRLKSTPEAKLANSVRQKEVQNRPEVKEKVRLGKRPYYEKMRNGEILNPKKGIPLSEETKKKLSESQKGVKGYWYGKTTSVAVKIINRDTGQVFESMTAAASSVNGHRSSLWQSLKKNRTYKKVRFSYYE